MRFLGHALGFPGFSCSKNGPRGFVPARESWKKSAGEFLGKLFLLFKKKCLSVGPFLPGGFLRTTT